MIENIDYSQQPNVFTSFDVFLNLFEDIKTGKCTLHPSFQIPEFKQENQHFGVGFFPQNGEDVNILACSSFNTLDNNPRLLRQLFEVGQQYGNSSVVQVDARAGEVVPFQRSRSFVCKLYI